jgi:menaquinone-dependent protoporphyrinogen IX oxidase
MNTLVVYYSKTGTTKIVADAIVKKLHCDADELLYDENAKTFSSVSFHNPANYERVIIMSPIWAFSLAAPMKLYLNKYKADIKTYSLVVTCGMFGLRGCISFCKKAIGKPPEHAVKFKEKAVRRGDFNIDML